MKTYNFKYGHGSVSLSLNEADILAELHGTETPPISDIRSALFASLEQPIDSAPLRQRVRPGDRVALVISDMTRFWMRQDLVIPHLVALTGTLVQIGNFFFGLLKGQLDLLLCQGHQILVDAL